MLVTDLKSRDGWIGRVARPGSSNGSGGIGGKGREAITGGFGGSGFRGTDGEGMEARRGLANGVGVVGGEGGEARTGGLGSRFGEIGGEDREGLENGRGASLCIDRLLGQKVARGVLGAGDPSLIPSLCGGCSVGGVLV